MSPERSASRRANPRAISHARLSSNPSARSRNFLQAGGTKSTGADIGSFPYRDIVSDKRVGHDPLLQPKIFGRVTGIEGAYSGFEFLAVAAGMQRAPDVVMAEDRKSRDGVTDYIIGLPQSLGPQEIIGHGYQGMEADVRYLAHPWNACVRAPAYQARN